MDDFTLGFLSGCAVMTVVCIVITNYYLIKISIHIQELKAKSRL